MAAASETVRLVVMGSDTYASERFSTLRFAEKDCDDILEFFTSSEGVVSDRSNAHRLVGASFTTDSAKELLVRLSRDTDENDLLIVFFAGHGHLASGGTDPILVTHDLDPERVERLGDEGLRMSFLQQFIFSKCVGHSLLFLDSCYSGNYEQLASERSWFLGAALMNSGERIGRHTAFLSCGSNELSFEEPGLANGRFTSRLLTGLRGAARGRDALAVTANFLFPYLQSVSEDQPPRLGGANPEALVLSTPQGSDQSPDPSPTVPKAAVARWAASPMENPLEGCVALIDEILDAVPSRFAAGEGAAEALAGRLFGTSARLESIGPRSAEPTARSSGLAATQLASLSDQLAKGGWRSANGWTLAPTGHARRQDHGVSVITRRYHGRGAFDALVVDQVLPDRWNNDGAAVLLAAALDALVAPGSSKQTVEDACADALRSSYGRTPNEIYRRRFESFQRELADQMVYFQPILRLAGLEEGVGIDGWEALARDPRTGKSPQVLFQAAEVWGTRFIVELDLTLARKGVEGYLAAFKRVIDLSKAEGLKALSVNVYPESLLSASYLDGLQDVLKATRLPPNLLVLEISEKRPLPRPPYVARSESATRAYGRMLEDIVKSHRITFAIDDFGSGHASLDRLSKLQLAHVKVDRSVLTHPDALQEIELVVDITRRQMKSSSCKIVVEGYDEQVARSVSLHDLYEKAKVIHIQGNLVELPRPELHGLKPRLREVIAGLVSGDPLYSLEQLIALQHDETA